MNTDIPLYTAEGYGLHVRSAKEMLALLESIAARIAALEARSN